MILISVVVSSGNAVIRYIFDVSSNAWLELQWYLFSAVFLLGAGYTLLHNQHVRIDIIAGRLSPRGRAWIDQIGMLGSSCNGISSPPCSSSAPATRCCTTSMSASTSLPAACRRAAGPGSIRSECLARAAMVSLLRRVPPRRRLHAAAQPACPHRHHCRPPVAARPGLDRSPRRHLFPDADGDRHPDAVLAGLRRILRAP